MKQCFANSNGPRQHQRRRQNQSFDSSFGPSSFWSWQLTYYLSPQNRLLKHTQSQTQSQTIHQTQHHDYIYIISITGEFRSRLTTIVNITLAFRDSTSKQSSLSLPEAGIFLLSILLSFQESINTNNVFRITRTLSKHLLSQNTRFAAFLQNRSKYPMWVLQKPNASNILRFIAGTLSKSKSHTFQLIL